MPPPSTPQSASVNAEALPPWYQSLWTPTASTLQVAVDVRAHPSFHLDQEWSGIKTLPSDPSLRWALAPMAHTSMGSAAEAWLAQCTKSACPPAAPTLNLSTTAFTIFALRSDHTSTIVSQNMAVAAGPDAESIISQLRLLAPRVPPAAPPYCPRGPSSMRGDPLALLLHMLQPTLDNLRPATDCQADIQVVHHPSAPAHAPGGEPLSPEAFSTLLSLNMHLEESHIPGRLARHTRSWRFAVYIPSPSLQPFKLGDPSSRSTLAPIGPSGLLALPTFGTSLSALFLLPVVSIGNGNAIVLSAAALTDLAASSLSAIRSSLALPVPSPPPSGLPAPRHVPPAAVSAIEGLVLSSRYLQSRLAISLRHRGSLATLLELLPSLPASLSSEAAAVAAEAASGRLLKYVASGDCTAAADEAAAVEHSWADVAFDADMLPQGHFPDEHKAAVWAPFFLPALVSLLVGTRHVLRRGPTKNSEKATVD
eukprot:gene12705-2324_t